MIETPHIFRQLGDKRFRTGAMKYIEEKIESEIESQEKILSVIRSGVIEGEAIAKACGCSTSNMNRKLRHLMSLGAIYRQKKALPGNNPGIKYNYFVRGMNG